MLTLDLALITHSPAGLQAIAAQRLPRVDGVRYIVSWQAHGDAPIPAEIAARDDIEVHRLDKPGLSNNRNNALSHCRADIILLADNDVTYTIEGLDAVRRAFEDNPEVDLATFRSDHGDTSRFPDKATNLKCKLPRGYYVTSIEIALRRHTAGHLRCCPEMGLGAPRFQAGEDEMLLMSAIHQGLNCRYFPQTICAHPHESTGLKSNMPPGVLRATGAVIALVTPYTAPLRIPLKAWRLARGGQASFLHALRLISAGAIEAPTLKRRNRDTLW